MKPSGHWLDVVASADLLTRPVPEAIQAAGLLEGGASAVEVGGEAGPCPSCGAGCCDGGLAGPVAIHG